MRVFGFVSQSLGVDGPEAWTIAESNNVRWDIARRRAVTSVAQAAAANFSSLEEAEHMLAYTALCQAYTRAQSFEAGSCVARDFAKGLRLIAREITRAPELAAA